MHGQVYSRMKHLNFVSGESSKEVQKVTLLNWLGTTGCQVYNLIVERTVKRFSSFADAYMTAFDGWVHDRFGGVWMLNAEALLAIVFVAAGLFALQQINVRCPAPSAIRP